METTASSAPTRWDLEDSWRARVEEKRAAWQSAVAGCRRLLAATSEEHSPAKSGGAAAAARAAAAQALQEYARVLHIFAALTVDGEMPEEAIAREGPAHDGSCS